MYNIPCLGLRIFLCPMRLSCWSIYLHKVKLYNLFVIINFFARWKMQAMSMMTSNSKVCVFVLLKCVSSFSGFTLSRPMAYMVLVRTMCGSYQNFIDLSLRSQEFWRDYCAKLGFGATLPSEILVDREVKIARKGHFSDDSNEYKFIYVPS